MATDNFENNAAHVRSGDVFLLSYPRSGNTWLRQMLSDIYFQQSGQDTSDPQFLIDHFTAASPTFEKHDLRTFPRTGLGFFLMKTHDARVADRFRFVYIYREAEDAIVSYRRFLAKAPIARMEPGLEAFCRTQTDAWLRHAGTAIANAKRGLFLSYRDMVANPMDCLGRACRFVGLEVREDRLTSAIAHNTPEVQRERYVRVGGRAMADYSIATARVGGNADLLSPELLDWIRRTTHERMRSLDALALQSVVPADVSGDTRLDGPEQRVRRLFRFLGTR